MEVFFVYLDDIFVASKTFIEHFEHLHEVFLHLRAASLRLKPRKCGLLQPELPFLGHVISRQGIRPDPSKTNSETTLTQCYRSTMFPRINILLQTVYPRLCNCCSSIACLDKEECYLSVVG